MNIKVLSIEDHNGEGKIRFETPIGIGVGVWKGETPTQGKYIDIEIEIDDDLKWGRNITMTNDNFSMIASDNNLFHFVAEILSYEDDGCLAVKLGESVVLLDVDDVPSEIKGWVEGKAKTVKLYPTNL